MTMVNFASQNVKFKNAFISQNQSLARKGNVLRTVTDRVMHLSHQTNK